VPPIFSELRLVQDPTDPFYRSNCKLWINFGSQSWAVGSGSLIDPKHVITAAHCVYDQSAGYAQTVEVAPAYENGSKPYGSAFAVSYLLWSGWINSGDHNQDLAVIELDRCIGELASWHSYGYDTDCSFYTTTTFYNPGYPADGPYDGEFM